MRFKYEETVNGCNRICPYCGFSYQVEGEDYSENMREEKCDECGKKFYAQESFTVDHYATPNCELNGEAHQWEPFELRRGGHHDFCSVCGKCRPFNE